MKKLLLSLASITLLTSCYDEGEIVSNPKSVYQINGKNIGLLKLHLNQLLTVVFGLWFR